MQTFSLAHTFIIDAQISNLILSTAKFILKIFIFSIMCSILNFNYSSPFKASLFTIRISHLNALIGSNGFFMVHLFVAISINSYIHKLIQNQRQFQIDWQNIQSNFRINNSTVFVYNIFYRNPTNVRAFFRCCLIVYVFRSINGTLMMSDTKYIYLMCTTVANTETLHILRFY